MVRALQCLKISSILFGLALGSASFALAISLDPSPAEAIPVSLKSKPKPAPKTNTKVASARLVQESGTLKGRGAALSGSTTNNKSPGK
jgi:hypothetical protein